MNGPTAAFSDEPDDRAALPGWSPLRYQPAFPLPADTTKLPTTAGPMIVGPMTVATWPIAGPMKVSPAPEHTELAVPAVAPWPSCPEEVPHGPEILETPPAEASGALVNHGVPWTGTAPGTVGPAGVLGLAAGAAAPSVRTAASAGTMNRRMSIIVVRVPFTRSNTDHAGVAQSACPWPAEPDHLDAWTSGSTSTARCD
jgi:hypothetical protein